MKKDTLKTRFAVCVKNQDCPVSLELRKIYQVIHDSRAPERKMVRVVDESGEDYLYPADYFVPIELPRALEVIFTSQDQADYIQ